MESPGYGWMTNWYDGHGTIFKWLSFSLHVFGSVHFTTALLYDYIIKDYRHLGQKQPYLFRLRFFSHWNLYMQWVYYVCRTINNLIAHFKDDVGSKNRDEMLNFYQISMVFPFALFVCATYWVLMSVNPNLVNSGASESNSLLLSHMTHTTILPLQILDYMTSKRLYKSRTKYILTCSVVISLYFGCMLTFYWSKGNWSYPIMGYLSTYKSTLFIFVCYLLNIASILVGETFNSLLWGKPEILASPSDLLTIESSKESAQQ